MKRSLATAALLTAWVVTAAAGLVPAQATPAPASSSGDAFYTPPAGYESAAPGTILKSRETQASLFSLVPQRAQAWQLLYRTTDQLGNPEATVSTVLLPAGATPDPKRPLVSYQYATDSADPDCAPSRTITAGNPITTIAGQAEILLVNALLVKGYAVSIPDYEGPNAAFGATRQAGQAVLDGIRAAEGFTPLGLGGKQTPVGMFGYSGGAVATNGAAEAQPAYAPELTIRGSAAGGSLGNDFPGVITNFNGGPFASLAASAIAGLSEAYPAITDVLLQYANDKGKKAIESLKHMCVTEAALNFLFANIDTFTTVPLAQLLALPEVKQVIADDSPGQHTPAAPMYLYHGVFDEVLPIKGVDSMVQNFCANGATITYNRDLLAEHGIALLTGVGGALSWLDDRLDGQAPNPGCHTSTVLSDIFQPGTAEAFGSRLIYANFLSLLGLPVGPAGLYGPPANATS
ncbi:lipase family protein [Amycolatopsis sp. NBC_00345]|uniref:lipase family protein n=1 Tax=Amycolatopsis sp. NBC_00345 TaxID=2975955 RepID=UPI002E272ECF